MGILEHIREQVRMDNYEFSMTPCSFCVFNPCRSRI